MRAAVCRFLGSLVANNSQYTLERHTKKMFDGLSEYTALALTPTELKQNSFSVRVESVIYYDLSGNKS